MLPLQSAVSRQPSASTSGDEPDDFLDLPAQSTTNATSSPSDGHQPLGLFPTGCGVAS